MTHHRLALRIGALLGMTLLCLVVNKPVGAHHSYLLTVQQLKDGLAKAATPSSKGFFLIDVRSPEEHVSGVIPGTDVNIEYTEIKARHREIGAKPDDHIVVYCQSGHRSNIAAETLADLGYRHVYNVAGSMNAWVDAGFPVTAPRR
ncbi:MAG: rhodanese-like domain-containing protein [Nitrospirota bacterium]|nr:rhodanese-like domain-containing protein [Nitrospirota bacterium]MDE3036321.1 rhodanese-like domain-containing protein [Nitrospirota bacterium]MDE3118410.1 rhodanese-like domain-containing protein [Nitrospirota bacterium]MDE3224587.1 rhodanese-like domain-containing protein [Nitrospirota bacterium]MDE3242427.1 rhodanese-like domain-containing protein [Nitrospirota bacterium]